MKVLKDIANFKKEKRPVILAAGFFDGIHAGHREIIRRTVKAAKKVKGRAWVLTLDVHPLKVVKPGSEPCLITSERHKVKLLERLGLDGCLIMPFSPKLARQAPEKFISDLAFNIPLLSRIIFGQSWRFGAKGAGDAAMLARLGKKFGFKTTVVRPVIRQGQPVSSTRIRGLIARGDLRAASILLGRPVSIMGTVVKGKGLGRRLGFPTANLDLHNEVIPPPGVYTAVAMLIKGNGAKEGEKASGRMLKGVLNIGQSPKNRPDVEIHLLDFKGTLYGRDMEVVIVNKIRNEKTFFSQEKLKEQISRDVQRAAGELAGVKEIFKKGFTSVLDQYYISSGQTKKGKNKKVKR